MGRSKVKSMTIAEAGDYFDEHDIFESKDVVCSNRNLNLLNTYKFR